MADIKNDLSTGLVSYWCLNETTGTRYDAHGSNHLTENGSGGVGYVAGKFGNAADFEYGDTDYLSITDAAQSGLDFSSTFSASFWVKIESDKNSAHMFFSKDASGVSNRAYFFVYDDSATPYLNLYCFQDGNIYWNGKVDYTLNTGTFYHIVVTFNAGNSTGSKAKFYVNGSDLGTVTEGGTCGSIQNTTTAFMIGYASLYTTHALDGVLDEFGLWNTVLTSGNVTTLYNNGDGIPYLDANDISSNTALSTSLVSYWDMDETTGLRYDSHGNNDLTDGGVGYATGKLNNAVDLTASENDYLLITDANQTGLDLTGGFTFNFWVNFDDSSTQRYFCEKWIHSTQNQYSIYYQADGTKRIGMTAASTCANYNYSATTYNWTPTDGTWYMVTYTYDNSICKIYLDGVFVHSASIGRAIQNCTGDLVIGNSNSKGSGWEGKMDEVGVWGRVLTPGEIATVWNNGTPLPYFYDPDTSPYRNLERQGLRIV